MSVSTPARLRHSVLVIDNHDSFTGSLVQMIRVLGCEVEVRRPDTLDGLCFDRFDQIVLSPGPGRPEERPINAWLAREVPAPIFGVCLGLQAIACAWGGRVVAARTIRHGRTSSILHAGGGCFAGLPSPFRATRYHSLAAERGTLPDCLEVTAWTVQGEVMGLRHQDLPVEAVQFHPESVRTHHGLALLRAALTERRP